MPLEASLRVDQGYITVRFFRLPKGAGQVEVAEQHCNRFRRDWFLGYAR